MSTKLVKPEVGPVTVRVCGCADKPVTMRLLKVASVGIIVEGVAGIFHGATLQHERIFLKQRKGFVKCAIQSGAGEAHPLISASLSVHFCCWICIHARASKQPQKLTACTGRVENQWSLDTFSSISMGCSLLFQPAESKDSQMQHHWQIAILLGH